MCELQDEKGVAEKIEQLLRNMAMLMTEKTKKKKKKKKLQSQFKKMKIEKKTTVKVQEKGALFEQIYTFGKA